MLAVCQPWTCRGEARGRAPQTAIQFFRKLMLADSSPARHSSTGLDRLPLPSARRSACVSGTKLL